MALNVPLLWIWPFTPYISYIYNPKFVELSCTAKKSNQDFSFTLWVNSDLPRMNIHPWLRYLSYFRKKLLTVQFYTSNNLSWWGQSNWNLECFTFFWELSDFPSGLYSWTNIFFIISSKMKFTKSEITSNKVIHS